MLVVSEVEALRSDHEEADTRLFLHTSHASQEFDNVIIRGLDTDAFIFFFPIAWKITFILTQVSEIKDE